MTTRNRVFKKKIVLIKFYCGKSFIEKKNVMKCVPFKLCFKNNVFKVMTVRDSRPIRYGPYPKQTSVAAPSRSTWSLYVTAPQFLYPLHNLRRPKRPSWPMWFSFGRRTCWSRVLDPFKNRFFVRNGKITPSCYYINIYKLAVFNKTVSREHAIS